MAGLREARSGASLPEFHGRPESMCPGPALSRCQKPPGRDNPRRPEKDLGKNEQMGPHLSLTTVAPQPPASGGASPNATTKGVRASTARTICRCTPIPRP